MPDLARIWDRDDSGPGFSIATNIVSVSNGTIGTTLYWYLPILNKNT